MKAGKIVCGAEAAKESLRKGKVNLLIIATDASEKTKKNLYVEAEKQGVKAYTIMTIEELSHSIGKNNKAIIGVTDIQFANAIEKNINGGDVIG